MNRKDAHTHRTTVTTTACDDGRCGECANPVCQHACHRPDTGRRLGSAWRDDWMPATKETLMDTEPFDPAAAAAAIERASRELGDICRQGARNRFRMSIPAQPDRDSDLIIAAGLNAGELALAELAAKPSPLLFPHKGMTDEQAAEWRQRFTEAVSVGRCATGANAAVRASQAAQGPNGHGDDAGAAREADKPAAGHTEPMRPEDVPSEAVKPMAETLLRDYDSEYGADHLSWKDFEGQARRLLAAAIPTIRAQMMRDLGRVRGDLMAARDQIRASDPGSLRILNTERVLTEAVHAVDRIARGDQ